MKLALKKASTDVKLVIFIQDSSSSTGAGLPGLAYDTGSLVCYYCRPGSAAAQLTLATQTVTGAHSDGGFVEIDSTNMPGAYRLDLSDAVVATGVDCVVVMLKGATNMAPCVLEIQLTSMDLNDAVRGGMTALPNANADAAGGLPISDAGGLDLDGMDGKLDTIDGVVDAILIDTGTTLDDLVDDLESRLGTPADLGSGATIAANLQDIEAQTDDIGAAGAGLTALAQASICTEARLSELDAGTAGKAANQIDLIKTETDKIAATDAGTGVAGSLIEEVENRATPADVATELGTYDGPTKAELDSGLAGLNDLSAAEVNAEVVDALATDTYAEPGQEAPGATISLAAKISYLFKAWRNKKDSDGSTTQLYGDDSSTVHQKQTTSESGGTVTKAEWVSGP